jgi:hypothetical protein
MKRKSLVLAALLLCSGSAYAQYALDTIVVRPAEGGEMTFSCNNLHEPSAADVESLLQVADRSQVPKLSHMLMGAVAEACNENIGSIVVERSKSGNGLSWHPIVSYDPAPVYSDSYPVYSDPYYPNY